MGIKSIGGIRRQIMRVKVSPMFSGYRSSTTHASLAVDSSLRGGNSCTEGLARLKLGEAVNPL